MSLKVQQVYIKAKLKVNEDLDIYFQHIRQFLFNKFKHVTRIEFFDKRL